MGFFIFLIVAVGILVGVWYFSTVQIASTVTVEVSNETRLLAYHLDRPDSNDGSHLLVYQPGTHTLGTDIKILMRVQTTPRIFKQKKEEFDTNNVQMEWIYEYEEWLVRSDAEPSDLPTEIVGGTEDEILDWAAKKVYTVYGHPDYGKGAQQLSINVWDDVIDRTIREELETVGRMFTPDELYNPEEFRPRAIVANDVIHSIVSPNEDVPLNRPDNSVIKEIENDEDLFTLVAHHIVKEVNRRHRTVSGLELRPTKFAIHNIEYQDEEMRKTAERRQKARLLISATQELIDEGRAESPQEAMLIALGQDSRYADVVIHTRWQNTIRDLVDKTFGRVTPGLSKKALQGAEHIIDRLEQAIRGKQP